MVYQAVVRTAPKTHETREFWWFFRLTARALQGVLWEVFRPMRKSLKFSRFMSFWSCANYRLIEHTGNSGRIRFRTFLDLLGPSLTLHSSRTIHFCLRFPWRARNWGPRLAPNEQISNCFDLVDRFRRRIKRSTTRHGSVAPQYSL